MSHQTFLLRLADCQAEVVPERGALLTRLAVGGRELLYLDHDTLADRGKNVRGGVPLLFPFAGKLPGDQFDGRPVKQHGFGRNLAWQVVEDVPGVLRMALDASPETRAAWPWDFHAEHTIRLSPRGATIELLVENRGDTPMPCAPGWHPYFHCPLGQKRELGLSVGFDRALLAEEREFDFGLAAPVDGRVTCELPFIGKFMLEFSPRMRHLQLWSQPGKPFVCIEPFWGPAGAILGEARDLVPPGRAHDYFMRLELVP